MVSVELCCSAETAHERQRVNEKETRTYASVMVHSSVVFTETHLYTCSSIQIHPVTVTLSLELNSRQDD